MSEKISLDSSDINYSLRNAQMVIYQRIYNMLNTILQML